MELTFPDVIVTEFRPRDATTMQQPVPPQLSRAVQRYLLAVNKVDKRVADLNLALSTERLQRRRTQLSDVADMLTNITMNGIRTTAAPAAMYVQSDIMELHRSMLAASTLKDTLENWVMTPPPREQQSREEQ